MVLDSQTEPISLILQGQRGAYIFLSRDSGLVRDLKAGGIRCREGHDGDGNMFTIVRKFRLTRGSFEEVTRRVSEGFVPLLRDLPGFRNYYLLDGGQNTIVSIRIFESADEALASNETAAEWMRDNVMEFVKGMPEVMAGDVIIAESK